MIEWKVLIPFYYTVYTRLKDTMNRVSYITTFFIPVLFVIYYFDRNSAPMAVILSFVALFSIYEIGYLKNDIVTTKFEKNPTLRLDKESYSILDENLKRVVLLKYIIALVSLVAIWLMGYQVLILGAFLLLIDVTYRIHNKVRGRTALITFMVLSVLRYSAVPVLFVSELFSVLMIFTVTIGILRFIEKGSRKKFHLKWLQHLCKEINQFRVLYYLSLVLVAFVIDLHSVYSILAMYYLIYRTIIYLMIKVKANKNQIGYT